MTILSRYRWVLSVAVVFPILVPSLCYSRSCGVFLGFSHWPNVSLPIPHYITRVNRRPGAQQAEQIFKQMNPYTGQASQAVDGAPPWTKSKIKDNGVWWRLKRMDYSSCRQGRWVLHSAGGHRWPAGVLRNLPEFV
ncbi:hypothetical protein DFH06DRAFT_1165323 [Mycena polygramma]|nr:hypothetical protein DFH06DRAFT_1165323 [Mycena polygramma]